MHNTSNIQQLRRLMIPWVVLFPSCDVLYHVLRDLTPKALLVWPKHCMQKAQWIYIIIKNKNKIKKRERERRKNQDKLPTNCYSKKDTQTLSSILFNVTAFNHVGSENVPWWKVKAKHVEIFKSEKCFPLKSNSARVLEEAKDFK